MSRGEIHLIFLSLPTTTTSDSLQEYIGQEMILAKFFQFFRVANYYYPLTQKRTPPSCTRFIRLALIVKSCMSKSMELIEKMKYIGIKYFIEGKGIYVVRQIWPGYFS